MIKPALVFELVGIVLWSFSYADAQPAWEGHVIATINIGYQVASNDFTQTGTYEEFVEAATFEADFGVDPAVLFDAGVAVRLWGNLGAGAAVSRYGRDADAQIDALIPHPFFFNRFRAVSGEATGLERTETAVHVQAVYMLPLSGSVRVLVSGGPSFFQLKQDLIARVAFTHTFPFDTATFDRAVPVSEQREDPTTAVDVPSESAVGFNVGADATWIFARHFGAGAGVRFSRASIDLRAGEGLEASVDAGGAHIVAGLRVLF